MTVTPTPEQDGASAYPRHLGTIYALADPTTGEIRYIGQTRDLSARVRDHDKGRRSGSVLREWLAGLENKPTVIVLKAGIHHDRLDEAEAAYIASYRDAGTRLLNVGDGGMNGRYDSAARRQSVRRGRERGCWIYLPMAELVKAGIDPADASPWYRVWGGQRGGMYLRLYKEA